MPHFSSLTQPKIACSCPSDTFPSQYSHDSKRKCSDSVHDDLNSHSRQDLVLQTLYANSNRNYDSKFPFFTSLDLSSNWNLNTLIYLINKLYATTNLEKEIRPRTAVKKINQIKQSYSSSHSPNSAQTFNLGMDVVSSEFFTSKTEHCFNELLEDIAFSEHGSKSFNTLISKLLPHNLSKYDLNHSQFNAKPPLTFLCSFTSKTTLLDSGNFSTCSDTQGMQTASLHYSLDHEGSISSAHVSKLISSWVLSFSQSLYPYSPDVSNSFDSDFLQSNIDELALQPMDQEISPSKFTSILFNRKCLNLPLKVRWPIKRDDPDYQARSQKMKKIKEYSINLRQHHASSLSRKQSMSPSDIACSQSTSSASKLPTPSTMGKVKFTPKEVPNEGKCSKSKAIKDIQKPDINSLEEAIKDYICNLEIIEKINLELHS